MFIHKMTLNNVLGILNLSEFDLKLDELMKWKTLVSLFIDKILVYLSEYILSYFHFQL